MPHCRYDRLRVGLSSASQGSRALSLVSQLKAGEVVFCAGEGAVERVCVRVCVCFGVRWCCGGVGC